MADMNAILLLNERHVISEDAFAELVVWHLPSPVKGSRHVFKYRLALVVKGRRALLYDNERGKGDHKHMEQNEVQYKFTTPEALLEDFWTEVDNWRY